MKRLINKILFGLTLTGGSLGLHSCGDWLDINSNELAATKTEARKPVSEKPVLRTVAGDGRRGRGLRPETGHAQRFRLHKITYMRGTRPFQTACNPHMWRYRASGPATTVRIEVADSFGRTSTKTMTRLKAFHIRMR